MPNVGARSLLLLLICFGFLINPLCDLLSIISSLRISLFVRGLISLLIIFLALALTARSKAQLLTSIALLLPFFSIFLWYVTDHYNSLTLIENVIFLLKALSFFAYIRTLEHLKVKQIDKIAFVVKTTLIIYMAFIIAGAIFEIQILKSYPESARFGYKGIVIAQNEASGLILASLLIAGFNFVVRRANVYDTILFITSSISAFLVGTKAAVLLPIIIVCIILWSRYGALKAAPYVGTISLASIIISLTLYHAWSNEIFLASINYFTYQFEHYAHGNIATLLLSGRNHKLAHVFHNYILENPWYLLLGGFPMGGYSVEIDFVDLAFLMGAPIFLIYCFMLYKAFRTGHSQAVLTYSTCALVLVTIAANTGGHILSSALVLPYLAVFCTICASIKIPSTPKDKKFA